MIYGAYTDFVSQRFCATALSPPSTTAAARARASTSTSAQLEASLQFLGPELLAYEVDGRVATRTGNRDRRFVPHGVYPCRAEGPGPAGERWLALACTDDEQWAALVAALGSPAWATAPELADAAGRRRHEDELDRRLAEWTADRSAEELFAALQPRVRGRPGAATRPDRPPAPSPGVLPRPRSPGDGPGSLPRRAGPVVPDTRPAAEGGPLRGRGHLDRAHRTAGLRPRRGGGAAGRRCGRDQRRLTSGRGSWPLQPEDAPIAVAAGRAPARPGSRSTRRSMRSSSAGLVATEEVVRHERHLRGRQEGRARPAPTSGEHVTQVAHRVELDVVHVAKAAQRVGIERPIAERRQVEILDGDRSGAGLEGRDVDAHGRTTGSQGRSDSLAEHPRPGRTLRVL